MHFFIGFVVRESCDGAAGCIVGEGCAAGIFVSGFGARSEPGVTYLDPDYMNKGIAVLSDESRRRLENAARLLGLSREAVA